MNTFYRRILTVFLFLQNSSLTATILPPNQRSFSFHEIWAYVFQGEEHFIKSNHAISDAAYFSASVNEIGRIGRTPLPEKIRPFLPPNTRIHCVISSPYNRSLMYWCLKQDPLTRENLIQDIVQIASSFDGIQINFESIRPEEKEALTQFLQEIKNRIPHEKIFSVTVPPQTCSMNNAYDYPKIVSIVDRVIVMAYDEHGRSASPGTIASLPWCSKVLNYAKKNIPPEKLVIGIPLYGRIWQKQTIARALKYFQTLDLWKQHSSIVERDKDQSPFFCFQQTVDAVVYFEDIQSLGTKLSLYEEEHIVSVALWRISQEPASLWERLHLKPKRISH
ncbi:MAG: hypothetical protein JW769_03515 [Parachlamydiales bacterium]|nr:hypothetical protein [Parachlamydiales bacterium]